MKGNNSKMPDKYYSEISALAHALVERAIPFQLKRIYDGWQICGKDWDVICHGLSYGGKYGYLESYGSIVPNNIEDDVEGWLNSNDILSRLGLIDHSDNEAENNEGNEAENNEDNDDCDYDTGYDPYMGCFSDDC